MSPTNAPGESERVKEAMRVNGERGKRRLQAEMFWVKRSGWLLRDHRLLLRPRFRENWIPSWELPENKDVDPTTFEDYMTLPPPPVVIDARKLFPDGNSQLVFIKRMRSDSSELSIIKKLKQLEGDSRNHCVPVTSIIPDKDEPSITYIVMPLLRAVDDPPFETVGQVLDFVAQMVEGLYFMHSNSIAHRDCEYNNIMMDAGALFSEAWHPQQADFDITLHHKVQPRPRSEATVKYYFIDFGLSVDVPDPVSKHKYVLGILGRDDTVPELSRTQPYDAFMVDIYTLGNMFRRILYEKYSNLEFLLPLIEMMTATNPDERPIAAEVRSWWSNRLDNLMDQSSDRLLPRTVPLPARPPAHTVRHEPEAAQERRLGFFGFTVRLGRDLGRALYEWLGDI